VEYVWFNNVETRPGQGYPRGYEDQERWRGGWTLNKRGRLKLKGGGRLRKLLTIFSNPKMPGIDDYYEPWTYDYDNLTSAPLQEHTPVARPRSLISGEPTKITWSANWDDNLGGSPDHGHKDPLLKGIADKVKFEFEQTFMFYLPRICEHCLNPSCAASCPSGAIYKRSEDGIVLVDQDRCRGWRMCVSGCPYKKVYFNHRTGKAEKCTFCFPRGRHPDGVRRDLRRPATLHRPGSLRRGQGSRGGVHTGRSGPLHGAAPGVPGSGRPRGRARG
jgi:nitrate reductase beta subunit